MPFGRKRKEGAEAALEEAVAAVDAAQHDGVDVSALRVLIRGVEKRIAKRRYDEAVRRVETVQRLTEKLVTERQDAVEAMDRLEELLERLRQADVDVSRGEAALKEIRTLFEGEKVVKGVPIPTYGSAASAAAAAVDNYERMAENVVKARRALSILHDEVETLEEGQELIRGLALRERLLGEPLTAAEEADRRLTLGEHETAQELAERALEETREIVRHALRAVGRHEELRLAVAALKEERAPTADLESELHRGRTLLEEGELTPAIGALDTLDDHLADVRDRYREGLQTLRAAEAIVAQAESWGFQTDAQRDILASAGKALRRGRWKEAEGLANRARQDAASVRETHKALSETLEELRLSADPENRGVVLPIIDIADRAMMEGDYDRAKAAIREAERRLQG